MPTESYLPATHPEHPIVLAARRRLIQFYRRRVHEFKEQYWQVTADDLGDILDFLCYEEDRRRMWVVFRQPPGLWEKAGYVKSKRRHGAPIPRWQLNEEIARQHGL